MQNINPMQKHRLPEKYSAKTVSRALAINTVEQRKELKQFSKLLKHYDSIMHRLFTDSFGGEPALKKALMTGITEIIKQEGNKNKKLGLHLAFVLRCFEEMTRLAAENNEEVTMGFIDEHPDDEIIDFLKGYGWLKQAQHVDGKLYYNINGLPGPLKQDIIYPMIDPLLKVCKRYGVMLYIGEDFDLYIPNHAKLVDDINDVLNHYKATEGGIQINPLLVLRFAELI